MAYARGKYAFGFCDRTGFRYPLDQLVYEYKNGTKTGLRVGRDVADQDHPQNFLGRVKVFDPQALRDPRPDKFTNVTMDSTIQINALSSLQISVGTGTIISSSSNAISSTLGTTSLGSVLVYQLFLVTVVDDGGNKYFLDGSNQTGSALTLTEGSTYRFDQSHSSNSGHPLRFSTTSNGTHGGGSEYTTGVTTSGTAGNAGAYVQITVAASAPTLYYYCTNHSGMGGQANTP